MLTPEQIQQINQQIGNKKPQEKSVQQKNAEFMADLQMRRQRKDNIQKAQTEEKKKSFLQKASDVSGKILGLGGLGEKAVDFMSKSEQGFGKTLGGAIATLTEGKKINEASQKNIESGNTLLELAQKTDDNERKKRLLNLAKEAYEFAGISYDDVIQEVNKSTKQIVGEGLGVATDIAAVGKYGKALNLSKAGTAKEAFKMGAKKYGIEGGIIGAGFGTAESMKEDETIGKNIISGLTGGLTGGIIGSITGGLMARKQYKLPEKVTKLRESAIEQYKRGLQATKEKYKEKAEKIIPDLLEDKVWGTHKSLMAKAEAGIALSNEEYKILGELKGYADISGITNMIDDEIKKVTLASGRVSSVNTQKVKALTELKADILAIDAFDKIKDNKASQQALRELAQQYGTEVYETRRAQKTIMDNKTLSQVKKVDSAIRDLLNKDPRNIKYAEINKAFHTNSELAEILSETAFRKEGHKFLNMIRSLSFGGGAVTGAVVGGAPGIVVGGFSLTAVAEILNSSWWNTLRAVQKNQLAKKLEQKVGQELSNALILLSRQGIKGVEQLLNQSIETED